MELLSVLEYAIIFPYFVKLSEDFSIWDYRVVFRLKQDQAIGEYYRPLNSYQYRCESCMFRANSEWSSSPFKVYESKILPEFVVEEIQQHVKDHQTIGAWAISLWKERHGKVDSTEGASSIGKDDLREGSGS